MAFSQRSLLLRVAATLRRITVVVVGFPLLSLWILFRRLTKRLRPNEAPPVARLCDLILQQGVLSRAQELDIVAGVVRVRHGASWKEVLRLPPFMHGRVVNRLKVMASLDTAQHVTQVGSVHVAVRGRDVVLETTIQPKPDGSEEVRVRLPDGAGALQA